MMFALTYDEVKYNDWVSLAESFGSGTVTLIFWKSILILFNAYLLRIGFGDFHIHYIEGKNIYNIESLIILLTWTSECVYREMLYI